MQIRCLYRCGTLLAAAALMAVLPATGCGKKSGGEAPPPLENPTQAEAERFGKELEAAVRSPQPPGREFVDWDRLYQLLTVDVPIPDKQQEGAKRSFLAGVKAGGGIMGQVRNEVRTGGHYQFLRVHEVNGKRRVLFRFITGIGAFNYHDFHLVKAKGGQVVAEDLDIFLTGEPLSHTMRRLFLQFVVRQNQGLVDRLLGRDRAALKSAPDVERFITSVGQKQGGTALAIYAGLPAEVKNLKFIQLMRMQAAMNPLHETAYLQAMTEFRQKFPGDPVLDFVSLDYYMLRREFTEALAALDRVDKRLGGDPYLDLSRGAAYAELGRPDDALAAVNRALKGVSDFQHIYWVKIALTLKQRKHPETLATLKEIDRRFQMDQGTLRALPFYADFLRSPQHSEWMAYLRSKPAKQPPAGRP